MLAGRSLKLALISLLFVASSGAAQEAAGRSPASRLVEVKISSPALKGNLLNDPADQTYAIYLPPSYDTSPTRRYPTLYLLHGFLRDNTDWTTAGSYQGLKLQPLMDEMIKSGGIREMIVVAPNGNNSYGGSFYINSPVTGNWEDYVTRDLVQNVDANFRTIAKAESRGIAGHSMGGYGAVSLAMKHPDIFSVVYGLSPCCLGMGGDFSENPGWLKTVHLTGRDQLKLPPLSIEQFYEDAFIALSAAFSPNPKRPPFYVDLPYQENNGQLLQNEKVIARWRSKMPLYIIDENKDNLMKLRGIFLDYGTKEEFSHIRISTQLFSKGLADRNIPHVFEIYEGGTHINKIRERVETRLLRFFSEKLDFGLINVERGEKRELVNALPHTHENGRELFTVVLESLRSHF